MNRGGESGTLYPMAPHEEAIVKSLVAVAWADGRMQDEEKEVLEAVLAAFELDADDAQAIRAYASTPRTLQDVPLSDLSGDDRRLLLQHAVLLTYVDGHQSEQEKELLLELAQTLHLQDEETRSLLDAAERRAEHLLKLL